MVDLPELHTASRYPLHLRHVMSGFSPRLLVMSVKSQNLSVCVIQSCIINVCGRDQAVRTERIG